MGECPGRKAERARERADSDAAQFGVPRTHLGDGGREPT